MLQTTTARGLFRRSRRDLAHAASLSALLALSTLTLSGCGPSISDASLRPLGTVELGDQLERNPNRVMLIDARSPSAFRDGTIPGAVNKTLRDVPADVDPRRFEGYKTVVVFGENPASGSARALAKRLMRAGVSDVYFYAGGYEAWSAGNPR